MFNPFDAAKARKAAKAAAIAADPKNIAENEVANLISNHPNADLEPVENGLGFLQADIELEAQAEKAAQAEADKEKTELATYALAKAIYERKQQMEKAKADAEARKLASKQRKEAARKATNALMQEYFTVDTEMDLNQVFDYVEFKTGLVMPKEEVTKNTTAKGKGKPPANTTKTLDPAATTTVTQPVATTAGTGALPQAPAQGI